MDGFLLTLWAIRLIFLGLIYLFLFAVTRTLIRDLRASAREPGLELGRLVVVASPAGQPALGASFAIDAVTTIGRDVNNSIELNDPFASVQHAVLTFRGRSWYVEDRDSTNGTFVNGIRVNGVAPFAFGDQLQVGQVQLRLERPRG